MNTIPLQPAEELVPAIAHLPEPVPARGTVIGVGVARAGADPVAVEFRTDLRRIGSDLVWVSDGPRALDGARRAAEDRAACVRKRLGDRCEEVRVQSHDGAAASVLAFFRVSP
ncbi:MAG: hypothetical protein WKG00_42000 [Polyangiaceae bacterium]